MANTTTDAGDARGGPMVTGGEFLERLAAHGQHRLLARGSGTMRFDVVDGEQVEHWYVALGNGEVAVSRAEDAADVVIHTDRPTFDAIATGEMNAFAATLRGALVAEGDLGLLMLFQRAFPPAARPSPARPSPARSPAGGAGAPEGARNDEQ